MRNSFPLGRIASALRAGGADAASKAGAMWSDRGGIGGVVLASLHFGPSETLPYWLRAHGIVATTIRGFPEPDPLATLTNYRCTLNPQAEIPVFLPVNELSPLPRFTHIRQFLGPGRRLLVEVDVDRGMQFHVPFEDRLFRMATGAIRLAAMADAELIPCLIVQTALWKFAIHFGTPVPRRCLGTSPDMPAVGAHLLREFSRVITRYPEQCDLGRRAPYCRRMGMECPTFPLPPSRPKVVDRVTLQTQS